MREIYPSMVEPSTIDIIYVTDGEGLLAVGDHILRAGRGELYIVPVSEPHDSTDAPLSSPFEVIRSRCDARTLGMAAPLVPMRWSIANGHHGDFMRLLRGIGKTGAALTDTAGNGRDRLWANFLELLLSNPDGVVLQPYERDESPIRQAMNVMGYRFMSPLSVAEISRLVAMSTRHFQRMFKSLTGRSFVQMLQEIRIRHSCGLLQFSKLSVQTVAESVGFSDMYHFYRLFRSYCGMTPAAFRVRYRT